METARKFSRDEGVGVARVGHGVIVFSTSLLAELHLDCCGHFVGCVLAQGRLLPSFGEDLKPMVRHAVGADQSDGVA